MGNAYLWNKTLPFFKSLWQPILSVEAFLCEKITLLRQNILKNYDADNRNFSLGIKENALL
jgi:hypothetical protein